MGQSGHFSWRELLGRLRRETRLRQRAAALASVCVFFGAVLVAAGLGWLLLIVVGGLGVAGGLALVAYFMKRHGPLPYLRRPPQWPVSTQEPASPDSGSGELYGWPYAGSDPVPTKENRAAPKLEDARQRALELNTRGAQLRRVGSPAPAVELHLQALAILESLGDRHAQAPTLNSLALALAASGDTDAAVDKFEQSLTILREREDEPDEGKVIANLGFTLLRHGAGDRGRQLLNEALEKLPPESPAAHQVEAQLRRAS